MTNGSHNRIHSSTSSKYGDKVIMTKIRSGHYDQRLRLKIRSGLWSTIRFEPVFSLAALRKGRELSEDQKLSALVLTRSRVNIELPGMIPVFSRDVTYSKAHYPQNQRCHQFRQKQVIHLFRVEVFWKDFQLKTSMSKICSFHIKRDPTKVFIFGEKAF